jgi:transcriptional regulator with AAA-type ATPase domain
MIGKNKLDLRDRDFFRTVAKSAFSNPFGSESLQLLDIIAGGHHEDNDVRTEKVSARIRQKLETITSKGKFTWRSFVSEDQELIRVSLLYDTYYRCFKEFDVLIIKQTEAGHTPCPVPFAKGTLSLLRKRGFNAEEALRYFGFYYQMRRAWYFIHHGLIGQNPSLNKFRCHLWRNIFTYDPRWYEKYLWDRMEDFSTFLVGETGTGKGTAAAAIGRSGFIPFDEKKGCFVESFTSNLLEINLSQFSESLIESELFGHKKGSFTGAVDNYKGVFTLCSPHGSIFLDEIGDVSIQVQIKLLKVLEERNFYAVGSHDKLHFDGRIIAATNQSLVELRQRKVFREDFYYRLCSNVISVPTLRQQIRENPATLETLLDHIIQKIIGKPSPRLLLTVIKTLERDVGLNYCWPGNVRELGQAVRCVLLNRYYGGDTITASSGMSYELQRAIEEESVDAQELLTTYCKILYQRYTTYEKVARITKLDPRTVKKYIQTTF